MMAIFLKRIRQKDSLRKGKLFLGLSYSQFKGVCYGFEAC